MKEVLCDSKDGYIDDCKLSSIRVYENECIWLWICNHRNDVEKFKDVKDIKKLAKDI